jgi:hypothetical protein
LNLFFLIGYFDFKTDNLLLRIRGIGGCRNWFSWNRCWFNDWNWWYWFSWDSWWFNGWNRRYWWCLNYIFFIRQDWKSIYFTTETGAFEGCLISSFGGVFLSVAVVGRTSFDAWAVRVGPEKYSIRVKKESIKHYYE